jgi:hypothetical protein
MLALGLFERKLSPAALQAGVASSLHVASLAALQGIPGSTLVPAAQAVLDDFQVWVKQGCLRTLGELPEVLTAARQLGPTAQVACLADYSIPVHGFGRADELANVSEALQEIVKKTDSKALHLVKEIYLRPFLAETLDGEKPQLVDGLAYGRKRVGLILATTRDRQATRKALFHELGHELDHVLSGGTTLYRSSQEDNPFGKTKQRSDYLSDYATTSPAEDFAECHAELIDTWDHIQDCPDLFIHGRGKVGEKLAWILERGYRFELPPPSEGWAEVCAAFSAERLQALSASLREHWPHPQGSEESWIFAKLMSSQPSQ